MVDLEYINKQIPLLENLVDALQKMVMVQAKQIENHESRFEAIEKIILLMGKHGVTNTNNK